MYVERVDFQRPAWEPEVLAAIRARLVDSGYQGLLAGVQEAVTRFARPGPARRPVLRSDPFTDVFIPPAHPGVRLLLVLHSPKILRMVVVGRDQQAVRKVLTATRLHLDGAVEGRLVEAPAEGEPVAERFRRDVLTALRLTPNGGMISLPRDPVSEQVLAALRRQPAFRGRPAVLASRAPSLLNDRPPETVRETLERLVAVGAVDRWHVVICRQGGQWLAASPRANEIATYASLDVLCPHCGARVGDEERDTAYLLTEVALHPPDRQAVVGLVESALRRAGAEEVAVHAGGGPVDGAACLGGTVVVFRVREGMPDPADVAGLQDAAARLTHQGWPVVPVLVCDQPVPPEVREAGVVVVDTLSGLDGALEPVIHRAREHRLAALLPPDVLIRIPVADLLSPG
ncbi:MAG: hypothetical protein QN173_03575 [Armatimonadota bacterium]|nr:hypothetical protein [Armatimonadota bacterium]MDR7437084.1 hypothetical protein [Armatimonadota bacterium]MDR7472429.1 hypothetical protein [Armatimonadota bacterium]MDR7506666.1 hypothetical protein [Armatimonadota bacterium]MDR7509224.1 hypothetical protein [Armatimonadota bacterium]